MTVDEFRECLDRYGGDLATWPPLTARAGRRLLAESLAAQAMLDEMVAIELALGGGSDSPPSDLADRIFEKAFATDGPGRGDADASPRPGRLM
ncbi:hypothetical protein [Azospirillum oleiclasticum]|uniref:hypothetical protein n=1 Tax=Azospirillum oleiclasticum TaxID=2735135 RepID=UPI0015D4E516|nr:hypothetical protein [Azospirillum oleiclasticum]